MTASHRHDAVTAPTQPDPRETPATPVPARPTALAVLRERIPRELMRRPQWVAWASRRRGAVWSMVPYTPGSGLPARVDEPDTRGAFDRAWAAYRGGIGRRRFAGIGYVLAAPDPYAGVTLDGCIAPTGAIAIYDRTRFVAVTRHRIDPQRLVVEGEDAE